MEIALMLVFGLVGLVVAQCLGLIPGPGSGPADSDEEIMQELLEKYKE